MKGHQKTAETEEGTEQIQEGVVAPGEDPTSVATASIQSAAAFPIPISRDVQSDPGVLGAAGWPDKGLWSRRWLPCHAVYDPGSDPGSFHQ